MADTNLMFNLAQEFMRIGKQKESVELLRKAAGLGHIQSIQIVQNIDYTKSLTKQFPINPLSIVDNEEIDQEHIIGNFIELYKKDIFSNLSRLQTLNNGLIPDEVTELLIYQTIDNLIEYKTKSLDILPFGVIEQVKEQIKKAFISVYIDKGYGSQIIENYESELMIRIWESGIVEKTLNYMEKLDNKHFSK